MRATQHTRLGICQTLVVVERAATEYRPTRSVEERVGELVCRQVARIDLLKHDILGVTRQIDELKVLAGPVDVEHVIVPHGRRTVRANTGNNGIVVDINEDIAQCMILQEWAAHFWAEVIRVPALSNR